MNQQTIEKLAIRRFSQLKLVLRYCYSDSDHETLGAMKLSHNICSLFPTFLSLCSTLDLDVRSSTCGLPRPAKKKKAPLPLLKKGRVVPVLEKEKKKAPISSVFGRKVPLVESVEETVEELESLYSSESSCDNESIEEPAWEMALDEWVSV